MELNSFWSGFAAGAAAGALAGVAGVLAFRRAGLDAERGIIRLEKSINIGRPVHEVFAAWMNLERLAHSISFVDSVLRFGERSRWRLNIDGREFVWDAQLTQVIPNESLGWKSVSGPHHTGRVSFAPLGDQTVVHVVMNYQPSMLGAMLPLEGHLEHWIDRGLREFKSSLESERPARTGTSNEPVTRSPSL